MEMGGHEQMARFHYLNYYTACTAIDDIRTQHALPLSFSLPLSLSLSLSLSLGIELCV